MHFSDIFDKFGRMLTGLISFDIFFTIFVQRRNICMFKNFRKYRQFYGIAKDITEKITKKIAGFL